MAEETLRYNIEIDQESLSSQLEQLRQQIDFTMGQAAISAGSIPQATAITGSPSIGMSATGAMIAPDVSQPLPSFAANMGAALDQAALSTQMGMYRLQQDAQLMGLLAQPRIGAVDGYARDIHGQGPSGVLNSLGTMAAPSIGGFDINYSGMTSREFTDIAYSNMSET